MSPLEEKQQMNGIDLLASVASISEVATTTAVSSSSPATGASAAVLSCCGVLPQQQQLYQPLLVSSLNHPSPLTHLPCVSPSMKGCFLPSPRCPPEMLKAIHARLPVTVSPLFLPVFPHVSKYNQYHPRHLRDLCSTSFLPKPADISKEHLLITSKSNNAKANHLQNTIKPTTTEESKSMKKIVSTSDQAAKSGPKDQVKDQTNGINKKKQEGNNTVESSTKNNYDGDKALLEIVLQYCSATDWGGVAEQVALLLNKKASEPVSAVPSASPLLRTRSGKRCQNRWYYLRQKNGISKSESVKRLGDALQHWNTKYKSQGKNRSQLARHLALATKTTKTPLCPEYWTKEEDQALFEAVLMHGAKNTSKIAKKMALLFDGDGLSLPLRKKARRESLSLLANVAAAAATNILLDPTEYQPTDTKLLQPPASPLPSSPVDSANKTIDRSKLATTTSSCRASEEQQDPVADANKRCFPATSSESKLLQSLLEMKKKRSCPFADQAAKPKAK